MAEKNQDKNTVVVVEGKYGILFDSRNWIVSCLNAPRSQADGQLALQTKDFDGRTNTYHMNLRQALLELSNRLLRDSLKAATKERALKLNELAEVIKQNDQWVRKAIMGRGTA